MIQTIFIDRDGTLLDEPITEIINSWDKFKIKNDIHCLAKLLSEYKFFIISNQEGINEGKLEQEFYDNTNKKLLSALGEHGIKIEQIYTCPHVMEENCDCRKPKTGLIEQATKDFQIDRQKSWIIGDRISDIKLAETVGMKSIFIQSELHKIGDNKPNFVAVNLCEAVEYITKNL
ncbi:MAG: HAD-IIIA family hydrolase [Candidatus Kerfeldbacteria bacterium]|nr:HAD-IIIA family hydrolase [Candidatus Kerfeldbacteria bacterium]